MVESCVANRACGTATGNGGRAREKSGLAALLPKKLIPKVLRIVSASGETVKGHPAHQPSETACESSAVLDDMAAGSVISRSSSTPLRENDAPHSGPASSSGSRHDPLMSTRLPADVASFLADFTP